MADDPRSFIEQTQSRALDYTGKEYSPEEMAHDFAKWDVETRVKAIQEMRAEAGEPLSVNQAAERYRYESLLRRTHEKLVKVGR